MDKKTIMWIVIGILAIAVLYVVFKSGSSGTGQVVSSAGQAAGQAASSGMVGGC